MLIAELEFIEKIVINEKYNSKQNKSQKFII